MLDAELGDLISYLKENYFEPIGVEPSIEAVKIAQSIFLKVYNCTLEGLNQFIESRFDAIVMINVLEHVPNPVQFIETAKRYMNPEGVLCVRVPNDFSELQDAASAALQKPPWWVASPGHINYFNVESLHDFFLRLGFEIVHFQSDFPMELFLLMGDDYIDNPTVGSNCHKKRVKFELSIPAHLRRKIYVSLGKAGVGRDNLIFGKIK